MMTQSQFELLQRRVFNNQNRCQQNLICIGRWNGLDLRYELDIPTDELGIIFNDGSFMFGLAGSISERDYYITSEYYHMLCEQFKSPDFQLKLITDELTKAEEKGKQLHREISENNDLINNLTDQKNQLIDERTIRIGDWLEITDHVGIVRKYIFVNLPSADYALLDILDGKIVASDDDLYELFNRPWIKFYKKIQRLELSKSN